MTIHTTYSDARARLAELLDKVADDRETVIITRRRKPAVALIAADELENIMTTLHLLRSPANARRLFDAIEGSERGDVIVKPVAELLQELGLKGASEPQDRVS